MRAAAALLLTAAGLALALLGAGCGGGADAPAPRPDVGWTRFGGDPGNTRWSSLADVTPQTVGRLGVAWTRDDPAGGVWETFPLVDGDTMYLTATSGDVLALDATTGRERWRHAVQTDFLAAGAGAEVQPVSRGVALGDGRVYVLTYDERLIALDQRTGEERWTVRVADTADGYTGTSPPTFSRGVLYLGSAGSDARASRGFVAAHDARTGRRLWRTFTVPPGNGGGRVWMPPTVDPRTGLVFAGTGNPSPAIDTDRRGCVEHASGLVVLDARTGDVRWGESEVCGDTWDLDGGQPPLVYDAREAGRADAPLRAVAHANKSGLHSLYDAVDGSTLFRPRQLVPRTRDRRRPTRDGVRVCPGALGGVPYGPAALDPTRRALFQPTVELCTTYRTGTARPGPRIQLGGGSATIDGAEPAGGAVVALDADTGRRRWRRDLGAPAVGGALATAGGLVFTGADDGVLYALDARDGTPRWRGNVGRAFGSAPLTYRVGGVQYVAVVAGGSSVATLTGAPVGGRLVVLRLGGRPLLRSSS